MSNPRHGQTSQGQQNASFYLHIDKPIDVSYAVLAENVYMDAQPATSAKPPLTLPVYYSRAAVFVTHLCMLADKMQKRYPSLRDDFYGNVYPEHSDMAIRNENLQDTLQEMTVAGTVAVRKALSDKQLDAKLRKKLVALATKTEMNKLIRPKKPLQPCVKNPNVVKQLKDKSEGQTEFLDAVESWPQNCNGIIDKVLQHRDLMEKRHLEKSSFIKPSF